MSVSSSIQFKGLEAVLDAFQSRGVPAWSLWQGKQFMFKCEESDMVQSLSELNTILTALAQSSNAIYTLKVYEDLGKGGKIKDSTPSDGSFNFKLNSPEQEVTIAQYSTLRNQNNIDARLGAIEKLLIEREEEEEEEPQSKLGVIGEILNDPGVSSIVVPLIMKAFGLGDVKSPYNMQANAQIAGINDEAELSEAIRILKEHDANLSTHLMKLAKIAQNDKNSFDFLLKTLDGL